MDSGRQFWPNLRGLGDNVLLTDVDVVLDSGSSFINGKPYERADFFILLNEHVRNQLSYIATILSGDTRGACPRQ
jgi:hypothetical protein